jgi:hypothetical protein
MPHKGKLLGLQHVINYQKGKDITVVLLPTKYSVQSTRASAEQMSRGEA